MLHHICGVLSGIEGIPEIWKTTGRPCIPRIIFIFQVSEESLILVLYHIIISTTDYYMLGVPQ